MDVGSVDKSIPEPDVKENEDVKNDNKENNGNQETQNAKSDKINDNEEIDEEWQDVLGTGGILRKILVEGEPDDEDSGPVNMSNMRFVSVIDLETRIHSKNVENEIIRSESYEDFVVTCDSDIFAGINLAIPLMQKGEKSQFIFDSRFTYGSKGNLPDVPAGEKLSCTITLKEKHQDQEWYDDKLNQLTKDERLKLSKRKKDRGNFWYKRENFIDAIESYNSACKIIQDLFQENSDLFDCWIACKNNLAVAYMKSNSLKLALQNVDAALDLQSNNIKSLFRKSQILEQLNEFQQAIAVLKQLLNLDKNNKLAQEKLLTLTKKEKDESVKLKQLYRRMIDPNGLTAVDSTKSTVHASKSDSYSSLKAKIGVASAALIAIIFAVIYTNYLAPY